MRRKHVIDVLADLYLLPNLFVRRVLNFLLMDLADSFHYTKSDVAKQRYMFASVGWILLYIVFCMLSPALLLFINVDFDMSFLVISLCYGGLFWVMVFMILIDIGIRFFKRLTPKILKYVKSMLGLQSEPDTDDYNKSAKVCRL